MRVVRVFSSSPDDDILELSGKLGLTEIGQGLMHSVLESSEQRDDGKLIREAINQGFSSFVPDDLYQQLVKNYTFTEQLYGKTFVSIVSGYDSDYVGRNVKIPEFQRELKKKLAEKISSLHDEGFLNEKGGITEKGMQLAALVAYVEEIDELVGTGLLGAVRSVQRAGFGDKAETHAFRKGDRYRDISLQKSFGRAARRGRFGLGVHDLETYEHVSRGSVVLIYGIDASGSMKGEKIDVAKKAGIALAFAALQKKDKVGLVVFSKDVKEEVAPTLDFGLLLRRIVGVRAARETNIVGVIEKALELFPRDECTKHLVVLTDALPTVGEKPEEETLRAAAIARARGVTVSVIGIKLDGKGERFGEQVAEIGGGKFYLVRNIREVDRIVLEDYYSVAGGSSGLR